MAGKMQNTRTGIRTLVRLTTPQVSLLNRRISAQRYVTRKLGEKGLQCEFDVENGVLYVESESPVDAETVSRELGKLITETPFDMGPVQAALMADVPDGDVMTSLDDAVVVKDRGTLKAVGLLKTVDRLSLDMDETDASDSKPKETSKTDMAEIDKQVTEFVPMSEGSYSYLSKYNYNGVMTTGDSNVVVKFAECAAAGSKPYAVKITGPAKSVKLCKERIIGLLHGVFSSKYVFGVRPELTGDGVNDVVKDIAESNSCTVHIELSVDHVDWAFGDAEMLSRTGKSRRRTFLLADSVGLTIVSVNPTEGTLVPYDTILKILSEKNDYTEADVIVNTVHRKLTLGVGGLSSALLKSCGGEIQQQLRRNYPDGIEHGELAVSDSGRLTSCGEIYHGALPTSKGLDALCIETCYRCMLLLVYNCLKEASTSGHVTIAFPALGTGALEYPAEDVAYLMYKAVRLFLMQCQHTSIEQIYFVLHPSAPRELKQIFLAYCVSQTVEINMIDSLLLEEAAGLVEDRLAVLFRVGKTLVKVLNADLTEVCHKSCPELVLWDFRDILLGQENRNKSSSRYSYMLDLLETRTAVDTDSTSRTVVHSFIEGESERELNRAVRRGLEKGKKENIPMLALKVISGDHLARDPASTTVSVLQGVKDSNTSIHVLAVFIPDREIFSAFVTTARGIYKSVKHPEAHFTSLVDTTWEDFSEVQIRGALRFMEPGNQALLTVSSDSEHKNRSVAMEIQETLQQAGASGGSFVRLRGNSSTTESSGDSYSQLLQHR